MTTPTPTPPPQPGRVPDQSMRSILLLCLEYLDQHNEKVIGNYRDMLEIRARFAELLANCEPEVTMEDEGVWKCQDSNVDLQAVINAEPLTIVQEPPFFGQLSDLEFGPLESFASSLQESIDLIAQIPQGQLPYGISSHETAAGDSLFQHSAFPEALAPSGSSSTLNEQLPHTVVQGIRKKVKCTWPGCSRVVGKDNLRRHINEMHWRKIKAICERCGKRFTRPYLMMGHNCWVGRRDV